MNCVLVKIVIFSGPPRFEGDRPMFGDRDGYRGGPRGPPGEFDDKGGAPADYQPSFRVSYHLCCHPILCFLQIIGDYLFPCLRIDLIS